MNPFLVAADIIRGQDWRDDALCAQVDTDVFFPEKAGASSAPAKRVCALCPVTAQCLQFALDNRERFGIWGGLSERERAKLRTTPTRVPSRTPLPLSAGLSHGTRSAYNAGCKCRACCAAEGYYQRNRHARRGNYGGAA